MNHLFRYLLVSALMLSAITTARFGTCLFRKAKASVSVPVLAFAHAAPAPVEGNISYSPRTKEEIEMAAKNYAMRAWWYQLHRIVLPFAYGGFMVSFSLWSLHAPHSSQSSIRWSFWDATKWIEILSAGRSNKNPIK